MQDLAKPLFGSFEKSKFLVKDSEIEKSKLYISKVKPNAEWNLHNPFDNNFKVTEGPFSLKKGEGLWAVNSFMATGDNKKFALKIYAQGDLKIYLNGTEVYNNRILTKRHYDEFNLTDAMHLLKPGKNVIGFELKDAEADSQFDFGLYQF
jgi:hypothetical protein